RSAVKATGSQGAPDTTPPEPAALAEQAEPSDGGAVIQLSKLARVAIALGCGGLAVAHVVWPTLPIDATFLGLFVVAIIGLFFDIERIDALGIHARARRFIKAARVVESLSIPPEPI